MRIIGRRRAREAAESATQEPGGRPENAAPAVQPLDRTPDGGAGTPAAFDGVQVAPPPSPSIQSMSPATVGAPPPAAPSTPPPTQVESPGASPRRVVPQAPASAVSRPVRQASEVARPPEPARAAQRSTDVRAAVRTEAEPVAEPAAPPSVEDELLTSRPLPRVLAVANQKGGVGKTTTTVNLGAALAELGYRVLVVDLDPQGNATTGLGIDARNFEHSMYDVLMRETPVEDCVEPTSVRNLFVAPSTIDLAGVEIELVPAFSRELRLRKALHAVVHDFDFVLIDCPPSLGLLTINGLAAAGEVLVPIQCEYYALEGLGQLLRNVHLVASNLNEQLEVSTIVLTMYDARTRLAEDVASEVRKHFPGRVCKSIIPRTVRLSEAPSFGQPITVFDPTSRGSVAYRALAKEVSNGAPKRAG